MEIEDHARISERRRIAEFATFGDIAQQSTHDLAAPRLGQLLRERELFRHREFTEFGRDVIAKLRMEFGARFGVAEQRHETDDRLTRKIVGLAHNGRFGNSVMIDERALNLRRRDAMAADVHHVVDAAHEPKIAVGIPITAIACEIEMFEFRPICVFEALRISIDRRFDGIDARLDRHDRRFGALESRIENLETDVRFIRHDVTEIKDRLERVERQGS